MTREEYELRLKSILPPPIFELARSRIIKGLSHGWGEHVPDRVLVLCLNWRDPRVPQNFWASAYRAVRDGTEFPSLK